MIHIRRTSLVLNDICVYVSLTSDDDSGEDGSEDESRASRLELSDEEEDTDAVPVYLWRPNQTTEVMGDWEKHTKVRDCSRAARLNMLRRF